MYYLSKAYLKNRSSLDTILAMSIVLFRLGEYSDSIEFANKLLNSKIKDENMLIKVCFLKAINHRKLKEFEESSTYYHQWSDQIEKYRKNDYK